MKKFIIKDYPDPFYGSSNFGSSVADPDVEISIPPDSTLDQALQAFTRFLKAAGYEFDGQYLDLMHYDDLK